MIPFFSGLKEDSCSSPRQRALIKSFHEFKSPVKSGQNIDFDFGRLCWKERKKLCFLPEKTPLCPMTLENYPLEYNCADALSKYKEIKEKKLQAQRNGYKDSKNLHMNSKLSFEAAIEEKRNELLSRPQYRSLVQLPSLSANFKKPEQGLQPRLPSGRIQHSHLKTLCSIESGKIVNNLKGSCKNNYQLCKHVHNTSTQYRVACTSSFNTCNSLWKASRFSVADGFRLTPIERDQYGEELTSKGGSEISKESSLRTHQMDDIAEENQVDTEDVKPHLLILDKTEEPNSYCWLDDATVTSQFKQAPPVDDVKAVTSRQPGSLVEGEVQTKPSSRKMSTVIKESSDALQRASKFISEATPLTKTAGRSVVSLKPEAESPSKTKPMGVSPSKAITVVEPRLPGLICLSDEKKSQHAEIKIWLNKSTFSGASKNSVFIS